MAMNAPPYKENSAGWVSVVPSPWPSPRSNPWCGCGVFLKLGDLVDGQESSCRMLSLFLLSSRNRMFNTNY